MLRFLFDLASHLRKTYNELVRGLPGLGTIDGIPEEYWWAAYKRLNGVWDLDGWRQSTLIAECALKAMSGGRLDPGRLMPEVVREVDNAEANCAAFLSAYGHLMKPSTT